LTGDDRAGANFSAISGDDANALRWDKLGYSQMMKLAEEHGVEAYIAKTPSFEYWDEMPSRNKIDSMAEYLRDVSIILSKVARHVASMLGARETYLVYSSKFFQSQASPKGVTLEYRVLPSQSTHQGTYNICTEF
jgi:hypothetical protein